MVGDAAGFVNVSRAKGIHYAIRSGMAAADTLMDAIERNSFSKNVLSGYEKRLGTLVLDDLRHARNFRQCFKFGLYQGAPLSEVQHLIPGKLPLDEDWRGIRPGAPLGRTYVGGMDKATFVSLAGAMHREDEPSHIKILDLALCTQCATTYATPCVPLCPGEVYRFEDGRLILSPTNCMHCGSCAVRCPYRNVVWTPPEGGEGPRFKQM